jgi:hypothetical protein
MSAIRLRIGAYLCLVSAPFLSFARTDNEAAAMPLDGGSALSTNAATASLERALAQAVTAEFSPLNSFKDKPPAPFRERAFFPDGVLLAQAQGNAPNQTKPPAANPQAPNVGDLGFPPEQTQGSAQDQALLDKRSHMLKMHQRLGLITTIPLAATLLTGGLAGGKETSSSGRDMHAALGGLTTALYFTTAYYSIFAPRVAGTTARGPIRLHKTLAWIHGPGMILTPILGVMAYDQKNKGEKVHGLASAHGAVGYVTAVAYGLAILSVSIRF